MRLKYEFGEQPSYTRGLIKGIIEGQKTVVYELIRDGLLSVEDGARKLEISTEQLKAEMEAGGYKLPDAD